MSAAAVLAAALVGVAVWLGPARRSRWPGGAGGGTPAADPVPGGDRARSRVLRLLVAAGCGLGAWAFVGPPAGAVVGLVVGVLVSRALARVEPAAVVRRRAHLERDLPAAVDLLAGCLVAGAAPSSALVTVGRALGGPVREELDAVAHRLSLGSDPAAVWSGVAAHPSLAPLGRAMERAHESGASVTDAVEQLARDLREDAQARVEERARTLEVKVAAPLGLCLLPAFVVLGIVPMVVGLVGSLGL